MKKPVIFLLDNGHGGVIDGKPQTAGKRSPVFNNKILYEGEFNRKVVKYIMEFSNSWGIRAECINLVPELTDVPLMDRVKRANDICLKNPKNDYVYVSIHANAAELSQARGWEVFINPKSDKGAQVANLFADKFIKYYPNRILRREEPNKKYKEFSYYVLKETIMPAILTENFFMTNQDECVNLLMKDEEVRRIALFHYEAMIDCLKLSF